MMANDKKRQPLAVSTISHACKRCGGCCRGRGDIFLSPLDVLRISQHLGLSCEKFVQEYCERADFAEVHLKATGSQAECIFLRSTDGKSSCAIYDVRPMACYLFPLGTLDQLNVFQKHYAPFCPPASKAIPVSEFVNKNSNSRYTKDFVHLQKFLRVLYVLEDSVPQENKDNVFEYLFINSSEQELNQKLDAIIF